MGALVAVALMAGAGKAGAAVGRFPADGVPSRLPFGRARVVDNGSAGALARIKAMLSSVRILRQDAPREIVRRSD
jgi:hypothetical protein